MEHKKKRGGWGMTYAEVWDNDALTIEAKAIYGFLCTFAGTGSEAYPSVPFMCEKLHISKDRFYKHMNLLIGSGVVKVEKRKQDGKFNSNIYVLTPNCVFTDTKNKDTENQYTKITYTDNPDTNNTTLNKTTNNNNTVNKKGTKSQRFITPTLEEVEAYCKERNNAVDAKAFIDFYESKGWMVGKNKMKDWMAAVRTWERREQKPKQEKTKIPQYKQCIQREVSGAEMDDLERKLLQNNINVAPVQQKGADED